MENVFSMDGEFAGNFRGLPIDVNKDLIPTVENAIDSRGNIHESWFNWGKKQNGTSGGNIHYRHQSRNIILAIPFKRYFLSISESCFPDEGLHYLSKEGSNLPQFKEYLKRVLEKYPPESFHKEYKNLIDIKTGFSSSTPEFREQLRTDFIRQDQDIIILLTDLLLQANVPKLTKLFIGKILSTRKTPFADYVYDLLRKTAESFGKLLQTVPWEDVKESVEFIIEKTEFGEELGGRFYAYEAGLSRWMDVYESTGINDIAHKIIELTLQKIGESEISKPYIKTVKCHDF